MNTIFIAVALLFAVQVFGGQGVVVQSGGGYLVDNYGAVVVSALTDVTKLQPSD